MSNLFFAFDLTPSLLAEKPLPDKAALFSDNVAKADAFAALLREQMSAEQPGGLNKRTPATPDEQFNAATSETVGPNLVPTTPAENTASEPVAPPAITANPSAVNVDAVNVEEIENELAGNEAPHTQEAQTTASSAPLPLHELSDDPVEAASPILPATPQTGATAETTTPPPTRDQWHFDRQLPRETDTASFEALPTGQPDAQRNARLTTIYDLVGELPTSLSHETRPTLAVETATHAVANEPTTTAAPKRIAEPQELLSTTLDSDTFAPGLPTPQTTVRVVEVHSAARPLSNHQFAENVAPTPPAQLFAMVESPDGHSADLSDASDVISVENGLAENEKVAVQTTASSAPLPLYESVNDSVAVLPATPQTEANAETTTPLPIRNQWHFDRQSSRETDATGFDAAATGQSDAQRNARLTTIRDLIGELPTNLPHEAKPVLAVAAATSAVLNEPTLAAAPKRIAESLELLINTPNSDTPAPSLPAPQTTQRPVETHVTSLLQPDKQSADDVTPTPTPQLRTRADSAVSAAFGQAADLNGFPTEFVQTEPPTHPIGEPSEAAPLSEHEADEAQSSSANLSPASIPLPLNQAVIVPAPETTPSVTDEAGQKTGQAEQTPDLSASQPVETAPTNLSAQAQTPVTAGRIETTPTLLKPFTQNIQAPLESANDQQEPVVVAPATVFASSQISELPAQPASATPMTSSADASVERASLSTNSVAPEPARASNSDNANNLEQSVAPPQTTRERLTRNEQGEKPPAATPAKPIFLAPVQTTLEQPATAPGNVFEPLAAAGVDNVLVEVAPATASPVLAPDFEVIARTTPASQKQLNANNRAVLPDVLLARSLPPDHTDSNAELNIRPATPTTIHAQLRQPSNAAPLPEQSVPMAERAVNNVSLEGEPKDVQVGSQTEIGEFSQKSETFGKAHTLNLNRAALPTSPDVVEELPPISYTTPALQAAEPSQAAAKATPALVAQPDSKVAAQPEIPNKPLTVGQVVRTVLKNDRPFAQPALPYAPSPFAQPALPYAPSPFASLPKPELTVPQATPITVESATSPATPAATQVVAPAASPATVPAQPAITNDFLAAQTERPRMTGLPSTMTVEDVPSTTIGSQPLRMTEPPAPVAQPVVLTSAETAPLTVPLTMKAESPAPTMSVTNEKTLPPALPNILSAEARSGIVTEPNHDLAEQAPALPVADEGLERIHHDFFTTAPTERSNKPGQRTFQLVLQAPPTASAPVQHAFEPELSNPVAAANRAHLQAVEPTTTPRPLTIALAGPSTEPAESAEPNLSAPPVQPLSETLSDPAFETVQHTQVFSPLDHCEIAPSSPDLDVEPLRTTFASIVRRFATAIPPASDSFAANLQPAPVVDNAPALAERVITDFQQTDTPREFTVPPSLQADLAALRAMTTEASTLAENTPAPVTRVFLTSTTELGAHTLDSTDEWLGKRQITDPPVSPTTVESVGTLTPAPVAITQNTTPQPEIASPTTYFSTNSPHAAWAANLVTNQLPASPLHANWNAPKPSVHSAPIARWGAALNHVAGPASRSAAQAADKTSFPWVALNTPLAVPLAPITEAPRPGTPNVPSAAVTQPVSMPPEITAEVAPTKPLERLVSPPPGSPGTTTLPRATGDLTQPRVAFEHVRTMERPLQSEAFTERATPSVAASPVPAFEPRVTPAVSGNQLDWQPANAPETSRENNAELAVNAPGTAATLERGTAVAQNTGTRDANVNHVTRQLAEPLIAASAELAPNEPRTIRLKLRPETLGEVEIVLTHDASGQYHAQMTTEREQTTHVLRSQLGQLREALEQAGLQVGQLDITTSTGSTGSPEQRGQSGQGWQDSQHAHTPAARIPVTESFAHEPATYSGPTTAHDGLLNLHA